MLFVQIDETKLNHNIKSHRGICPMLPSWAATGFATLIPDRQTNTIILVIERVVRPGSIIHTDINEFINDYIKVK